MQTVSDELVSAWIAARVTLEKAKLDYLDSLSEDPVEILRINDLKDAEADAFRAVLDTLAEQLKKELGF